MTILKAEYSLDSIYAWYGFGGGNLSLVLVGTRRWEFEIWSIQEPTFHEKVTHSYTNQPNFGLNFVQNYPIFYSNFLKFTLIKFLEILKNWPIHIPYFA